MITVKIFVFFPNLFNERVCVCVCVCEREREREREREGERNYTLYIAGACQQSVAFLTLILYEAFHTTSNFYFTENFKEMREKVKTASESM